MVSKVVVEDLSRDLIEILGTQYDIDPRFFRHLINDHLYYNTRDPWAELPPLLSEMATWDFMTFSFLRARHYHDEASWNEVERQSGMFNVLRRLDSDRCRVRLHRWDSPSAGVALARSKVAMWSPQSSEASPRIVVILVDPTTTTGEQVWAGLGEGYGPLSMHDVSLPKRTLVGASTHFTPDDLRRIAHDTRFAGAPMINIVLREWLRVTQYMDTVLGNLLWEFEKPHWGEHAPELDHSMKKLSPWQRNILNYRGMVDSSLSCLSASPHFDSSRPHDQFRKALQPDFERAAKRLQPIQHHIETMADGLSSMTAIEDARRATLAAEQSIGLTFLSILAPIFLPLNFVTSFFSMSSDLSLSNSTFGLFFVLGMPLTLATVFIVGRSQDSVGTWLRESRRAGEDNRPIENREQQQIQEHTVQIRPGATRYNQYITTAAKHSEPPGAQP
ncbi:Putative Mg2+ transporter protein, CorA-like/Zinc transport protein ZntB [Septoria linicola]|uniref:Mg2+ transporter protein, CorA-like/Zinc transport protein ZntB n=1 Tax=Septoria linicola TaxID=215465 RepID=A0A9Q9EPK4_9PEZI|nr:Putative Mg2+ transporter protein, CorA-like/Zinc transport protein ZntB [Septoria linicola]